MWRCCLRLTYSFSQYTTIRTRAEPNLLTTDSLSSPPPLLPLWRYLLLAVAALPQVIKVFAKTQPSQIYNNFVIMLTIEIKIQPTYWSSFLCILPSRYLLHVSMLNLVSRLPVPEGRGGIAREPTQPWTLVFPIIVMMMMMIIIIIIIEERKVATIVAAQDNQLIPAILKIKFWM